MDSLGNNLSPDNDIQFTFLDARLNKITAALASEHDAVCIFVNDGCNAEVIEQLHLHGVVRISHLYTIPSPPSPSFSLSHSL